MAEPVRFPLADVTYDLISILHDKSKSLEAFDQYMEDAEDDDDLRELLEEIRQADQRFIHQLQAHLRRVLMIHGARGASEAA